MTVSERMFALGAIVRFSSTPAHTRPTRMKHTRPLKRRVLALTLVVTMLASFPTRAASSDQKLGDAYIRHDASAGTWTIGAGGASLAIAVDSARDFQLISLTSPSGQNWLTSPQAGAVMTVNDKTMLVGSRANGFRLEKVATSSDGHVLRLDATFLLRPSDLRVTRHVSVADGSPTFEMWTTFESVGNGTKVVANLNALQLVIPSGAVRWLTGRQGDADDETRDSAFMLRQRDLSVGEQLVIGADARSSEREVPWLAVDGPQDEFYAALMWSGPWLLIADRQAAGMALAWGLGPMATEVGGTPVDGPHALFGVVRGALPEASAALRSFVVEGLRGGRPFAPLVTYNTWFAYGTDIDENSMRREMERAANVGAELFVIDAGWYVGADTEHIWNFDEGLGAWDADPARFPNGLRALVDAAHNLGMKFGIWVEPERVNLSQIGDAGVDERWLASSGSNYGSDHAASICLAGEAGRQWVMDRLTGLIDAIQPDYLKWDNNLWTNCDRAGHNHGSTDGSFAHVTALYRMLAQLRERYPDLLIENCSGGGNRIDFGMLRYSDAAWMDDRTVPSAHVRHNIQGLSVVFPPAYLLSFVLDDPEERLHGGRDQALYFRSRMGGILGLCYRAETLSSSDIAAFTREIAIYKDVRSTLTVAAASLLTAQASVADSPDWDVLQASTPANDSVVVYAYQDDLGSHGVNVKPTNLQRDTNYEVTSVDVGVLGTATGADIMADGIDIVRSPETAAHILRLKAIQ
jgi:alpha-galactosidase